MAKHGLERNKVMAQRDFYKYQSKHPSKAKTLDDFRLKDYSGLTELTGKDNVADAEFAAEVMVNNFETGHDTTELWRNINLATKSILQKVYECGLLSKENFEKIRDMFKYYVPLRGWDDKTSDEVYGYLTSKNGAMYGSVLKRAEDRTSKADDPLATIAAMAEAGIAEANRNAMKMRFLNFVLNHPSDAVSVNKLWLKHNDVTDEWEPVFADLKDTDDAATIEQKIKDFEDKLEQLSSQNPDQYKSGKDAVSIPYIIKKENINEHQVLVKRGGETYTLTINGNPRAAQALNGLTNPDTKIKGIIGELLNQSQELNRWLSSAYTTRNPEFTISNFIRDAWYTNLMTDVKESPKYAAQFHKNYILVNPARMGYWLDKFDEGTLDMHNEMDRLFYQFMMNGGETGYTLTRDVEKQKELIKRELKKYNQKIPTRLAWQALANQFDRINRSIENCARFASFVTSRKAGRSIERSIWDAKEISVNFNKKGAGSTFLNAKGQTWSGNQAAKIAGFGKNLFVFWNAGVQGLNNFSKNIKKHPIKGLGLLAILFSAGLAIPSLLSNDEEDDSNYFNLPEYVRRTNICFRVGGRWITIPLPIELRAFWGLGELAGSVISGHETGDGWEITKKIAAQISQLFPLDIMEGGGGLKAAIPSFYKPIYEIRENEDWTGLPIYKDNPYNKDKPEWTKAYSNTNEILVAFTKYCNEITGGDAEKTGWIDFNPAMIEHLMTGYLGGIFTIIDKFIKTGATIAGVREFDTRNIPILSRVVKNADERTAWRNMNEMYYDAADEYGQTESLLSGYHKRARNGEEGYLQKYNDFKNSSEYKRYEIIKVYKKPIDKLQSELKNIEKEENAEAINAVITMLKVQMLKTLTNERQAGYPQHKDEKDIIPRNVERGIDKVNDALNKVNKERKRNDDGRNERWVNRAEEDLNHEVERFSKSIPSSFK